MKAKRPKFLQNVQAHIDISEIILNTQDFEENENIINRLDNRSSDLRPTNNVESNAKSDFEMKLSSFNTLNHRSMPTNNNMANPNSMNGIGQLN